MGRRVLPPAIVQAANQLRCDSIAYTYTEPVVFLEYALDTAKLTVDRGLKNIFVTNGYITEDALRTLAPFLHAANIDLKSFSDTFYRENCGARLQPVLDAIKLHKKLGIWIEVTTLIIPTLNDSEETLTEIATFLAEVGVEIPWHVSRFYPTYELIDLPPTPRTIINKAREIGLKAGLRYIYQGNLRGEGENTYCYNCGELLIERYGYQIVKNQLVDLACPRCSVSLDGVLAS
jgi:pyruvate formate lyase activating enzyme